MAEISYDTSYENQGLNALGMKDDQIQQKSLNTCGLMYRWWSWSEQEAFRLRWEQEALIILALKTLTNSSVL